MHPSPSSHADGRLPAAALKLLHLIARQAAQGPLHPKAEGTATPLEILEACGLDVEEFYALLDTLVAAGLIRVVQSYPFEEIHLTPDGEEWLRDTR